MNEFEIIRKLKETYAYDDMNRLTGITLKRSSGQDLTCAVTYDALGRMTSRQAVTAVNLVPQVTQVFSQPVFDATKVHALASATTTSGIFPPTPQTVTYTGFDKVSKVKQGTDSICYTYGYDHQRIYMEEHAGTNYWRTFVTGPYGVFAVVESRNGTDQFHYVLKDNLGSWTTITNVSGTVEQQLSYDAWGNLRNPNSWANYRAGDTYDGPMFDRGFTGHEHLYNFGLINMNGRMYDPVTSSFLSVDQYVQSPENAQGFNRYAYCMNNPLRYVDPSGWLAGGGNTVRVTKFDKEKAETPLEEWMRYLNEGYIAPDTTAPGLQKAREKLRVLSMTDQERWDYEQYLLDKCNERAIIEYAEIEAWNKAWDKGYDTGEAEGRAKGEAEGRAKGEAEGRAKGEAEGEAKATLSIVQKMKAAGMDPATITQLTDYSEC
ncbi:MAG: hypothetical protein K6F96_09135 [Bacteroidales bacterium]|nr:hypothetical protein [Bacteroidales bacterium]